MLDLYEISVYIHLFWDKDFIALAKKSFQIMKKTYAVGTHEKRLTKALLMNNHNISFIREI